MLPLQFAYYTSFFVVSMIGFAAFWKFRTVLATGRVQVRRDRYAQLQDIVQGKLHDPELNSMLKKSGFPLTAVQYQVGRYSLFLILLASSLINNGIHGRDMTFGIINVLVLFLLSSPKPYIMKRRTPFKVVMDLAAERNKYRKNLEIYRAISQLKNLMVIKQHRPPGALFIFEQLNRFTKLTKPIFNQMILLWQLGRKEEACQYFVEAMDTEQAQEIASILQKLDEMNPLELKNQLVLYQQDIKQRRKTEKLKQNQYRSHLITAVVFISLAMVIGNFLVVGFLLDMMASFKSIS